MRLEVYMKAYNAQAPFHVAFICAKIKQLSDVSQRVEAEQDVLWSSDSHLN